MTGRLRLPDDTLNDSKFFQFLCRYPHLFCCLRRYSYVTIDFAECRRKGMSKALVIGELKAPIPVIQGGMGVGVSPA